MKYLFSFIENVVALIAGRKAMAPLMLQITMMARITMTLVILNVNTNIKSKSANSFPNKYHHQPTSNFNDKVWQFETSIGQIVLVTLLKMRKESLILKFIHNFRILVTLLGENANNFTKLKQTSNKESFGDMNTMWRKFTQL